MIVGGCNDEPPEIEPPNPVEIDESANAGCPPLPQISGFVGRGDAALLLDSVTPWRATGTNLYYLQQLLSYAQQDQDPHAQHVQLRAHGLPARRRAVYELWCVRTDGRWINGGSFHARADGTASAQLTAAVRPGEYHLVVVTGRSEGGRHGAELMRGKLSY